MYGTLAIVYLKSNLLLLSRLNPDQELRRIKMNQICVNALQTPNCFVLKHFLSRGERILNADICWVID